MVSNEANVSALYVPSTISETVVDEVTGEKTTVEYPVKVIGQSAFFGNPWIVKIYFEEGIEEIQLHALGRCNALEEINLPTSLKVFYGRFEAVSKVQKLVLPDGLTTLHCGFLYGLTGLRGKFTLPSKLTTVLTAVSNGLCSNYVEGFEISSNNNYFKTDNGCWYSKDGTKLYAIPSAESFGTSFTIPDTVTDVIYGCFYNSMFLTELVFGTNVTNAPNVITNMSRLKTLRLNAKLTTNPLSSYFVLPSLETVTVENGSTSFASQDGILYNANKTAVVLVPAGKQYDTLSFAPTVTSLERRSCTGVRFGSVVLHEGLETIGFETFTSTVPLAGATDTGICKIPSTLKKVEIGAFVSSCFLKFEVSSDNQYFSCEDYVLYNKDKTEIVALTAPRDAVVDYVFPSTVTRVYNIISGEQLAIRTMDFSNTKIQSIGSYAVYLSREDSSVILPDTLQQIYETSILLRNVATLTIPSSVNVLYPGALFLYEGVKELIFLNTGTFTAKSIFGNVPRTLVIKGYRGSTAEEVAKEYTLLFEPLN